MDIEQLVLDNDSSTQPPHDISSSAERAAEALRHGAAHAAVLHSDGTEYRLIVMWTDECSEGDDRFPPVVPTGRLLVTLVNFRRAWHFGPDAHRNYVKEKLAGLSEWDAEVIAQFIRAVHRHAHNLRTVSRDYTS